jgi:hypothetical protein
MEAETMKRAIPLLLVALLLAAASLSLAKGNSTFTLAWWTADGGGGMSSNGRYYLQTTIGQFDAGGMTNGRYVLLSGYWDVTQHRVYLPLVIK